MFGPHLIIDGSRCDTRKLADRNLVEQVLNDYPTAIGMTKIGGPYMFEYQAPDPAYSGVSGLVVIAESHIAIHTFPELDYFTMDIFSCKNFDHELAIDYIKKAFDVQEMDRMLVQRGLSFKGPHHGRNGATDELIAAAEARLAAGIVSKEPALPDDAPAGDAVVGERNAAIVRRADRTERAGEAQPAAGHMIWPQYGVTPDYGTYGDETSHAGGVRAGATVTPLGERAIALADSQLLQATEPVQVNPTASISGLLDKMAAIGGQGRALGRALSVWERLVRDADTTIALTLAAPILAEGLRELLVYAVEHRYVDVIVASADDLFADLYESLGYAHYEGEAGPVATDEGRERTRAVFAEFLAGLEPGEALAGGELWQRLGAMLPTRVPRKGLLQSAAACGVRIVTPDLGTSAFGGPVLAALARGASLTLDVTADVVALARLLAEKPRLGVVRCGEGAADALVAQARDLAPALSIAQTTLSASVTFGSRRTLGAAGGEHHVAVASDATLTLPLVVTGLAQRVPGSRTVTPATAGTAEADIAPQPEEPALA